MPLDPAADYAASKDYYEDFSLRVGLRDWLAPNPRHARLRTLVSDILAGRDDLRLLDVGCGVGVMTSYLTRYGSVTGTDFSTSAIAAAQRIVPEARFFAGTFDDLPAGERYDAVMLFDVLEHIPEVDRPGFLGELVELLTEDGVLFMSTPYPDFTARRKTADDATLQVIDEEVRLADVIGEAAAHDLQLVEYRAFDVFKGTPEYQAMAFRFTGGSLGGPPVLTDARTTTPDRRLHRGRHALRALRAGRPAVARWFLTGDPPDLKS